MGESILYRWPESASFGRMVPKAKFYEHGNVRSGLREQFVNDVQRVTWAYKLAGLTIRLNGSTAVPEIQVFTVETKGNEVSDEVLAAIDEAVHFPIIFEIADKGRLRTAAAQKSLDGRTPKIGAYFKTEWQAADSPRTPLPAALDLPTLYEAILVSLLPLPLRSGETVSDATRRLDRIRGLERQIGGLERKLREERQFNRKIEFRRQIRERRATLEVLSSAAESNKE